MCLDVGDGVCGGDVFENDAQAREAAAQWLQGAVDEGGFAVEDVHAVGRDFAVDEEQQSRLLHRFQDGVEFFRVGDALGGVGGRAFGIPFDGDNARGLRCQYGFRGEAVAEV